MRMTATPAERKPAVAISESQETARDEAGDPCFDGNCAFDVDAATADVDAIVTPTSPPVDLLGAAVASVAAPPPAAASLPALESVDAPGGALQRLGALGPTVWGEFGMLAADTDACNLGQGFPNWPPPPFVLESATAAVGGPPLSTHQYTRSAGHPPLAAVLAQRYSVHLQREVDPLTEVAVTVGASQALYLSLQCLLNEGDEVIMIEPFFDLYLGQVRLAGGVPKFVPMKIVDNRWVLDPAALAAAITPRTRAILLNTPHNPTGKVFSLDELAAIAAVVARAPARVAVLADEVYKYTVHSGASGHVHFASLPGMWDRTLTISSAGKTFSVTGWQVGWVIGPAAITAGIRALLPYVQFCAATPMQEALARTLRRADEPYEDAPSYYHWLRTLYARKRAKLAAALEAGGLTPLESEGGYFLMADISAALPHVPARYLAEGTAAMPRMTPDWAFCRWLAIEHGVAAIPASPFFSEGSRATGAGAHLARFAFCKTDDTLDEAMTLLSTMRESTSRR